MRVSVAIERYLTQLKENGFAGKTIDERVRFLETYRLFLTANDVHEVSGITKALNTACVKDRFYIINQYGRQNSVSTRNNEINAIRSFLRFVFDQEWIPAPLADDVRHYRDTAKRIPKDIMTRRELVKVFKQPDMTTLTGYRDRMMMEILYATGMWRSELKHLRLEDIRYSDNTILIRGGKRTKDRVVPVNETALTFIRHYVDHVRPKLIAQYKRPQPTPRLIVGTRTAEFHEANLTLIIKEYVKQAKLKKHVTVHSFRHTFATHVLQNGMPLRHVQELLGHEKLDTTIRYLHLNLKDLQREYKKYHPRERE